ncbi:hypothetical protein KVP10_08190 [Candidimonas humi]|uniref:Uncharacterized protein n=1 Tax=Candidimonas humi TaxID=683355 RepID=A0ABV8NXS9_9BURK|nr:hypothetical protein [Candidimonas humi]MBV6304864.1 hypothetical protein [Candidimonas humi]
MGHLKTQNQLSRINGDYQQLMEELQAHGIDTNPFGVLQIERFALVDLLIDEIRGLKAKVDMLGKIESARKKRDAWHVQ